MKAKTTNEKANCPAEMALKVIGGRWKILIIKELFDGVKGFNELRRSLKGVTQKMLTQQLREMEADGIINQEVYLQVPPKVEYSLTSLGKSLQSMINEMHEWGNKHLNINDPNI